MIVDPARFHEKPLILRRLDGDDFSVRVDGLMLGRIMLKPISGGAAVWLWTITGPYMQPPLQPSSGDCETLEQAKAALRGAWDLWLRYARQRGEGRWHPGSVEALNTWNGHRQGWAKRLKFVPDRFAAAWDARHTFEEGARREVALSKAECDPILRKAALKAHGEVCCDCGIIGLHRLEVHHLNPIAEGQRRSRVEDVVVVCRNCHADRDAEMRLVAA